MAHEHVFSNLEDMINSQYSTEISKLQNEKLELQYKNQALKHKTQELQRKPSLALQQQSDERTVERCRRHTRRFVSVPESDAEHH